MIDGIQQTHLLIFFLFLISPPWLSAAAADCHRRKTAHRRGRSLEQHLSNRGLKTFCQQYLCNRCSFSSRWKNFYHQKHVCSTNKHQLLHCPQVFWPFSFWNFFNFKSHKNMKLKALFDTNSSTETAGDGWKTADWPLSIFSCATLAVSCSTLVVSSATWLSGGLWAPTKASNATRNHLVMISTWGETDQQLLTRHGPTLYTCWFMDLGKVLFGQPPVLMIHWKFTQYMLIDDWLIIKHVM